MSEKNGNNMDIRNRFEKYFAEWLQESSGQRPPLSSHLDHYTSDKLEKIIELGKEALPFIIKKMKQGHFILNQAISEITKIHVTEIEQSWAEILSEQKISKLWIKWWEDNQNIPEIEIFIAPWAMSNEEIPFHVSINKTVPYSKILIEIPKHCSIKELINVLHHETKNGWLEISQIGENPLAKTDQFGVIMTFAKIFDDLAVSMPIKITLVNDNGNNKEMVAYARIFRPLLEINEIPSEIFIDGSTRTILPIRLAYQGFGDIALRVEGNVGGNIVTKGGTLFDTILYSIMKEGLLSDDQSKESQKGINIDQQLLFSLADELKTKMREPGYILALEQDPRASREFIDWLKEMNRVEQEKFMSVLYETMETHLVKKITDSLYKSATNKTHLDSGTEISTEIKTRITNIGLKIFYRDLIGNVYPPLKTFTKIVDQRDNPTNLNVTIPVEIKNVDESKSYKNVEGMQIGARH